MITAALPDHPIDKCKADGEISGAKYRRTSDCSKRD